MPSKQNRLVGDRFCHLCQPNPEAWPPIVLSTWWGEKGSWQNCADIAAAKGTANHSEEKIKWLSLTIGFNPISIFSPFTTHLIYFQVRLIPIQDRRRTLILPGWPSTPRNTPHLTQRSFQSLQRMDFRAHLYKTEERQQFSDRSSLCTSLSFKYWKYHGIRQSQGYSTLVCGDHLREEERCVNTTWQLQRRVTRANNTRTDTGSRWIARRR